MTINHKPFHIKLARKENLSYVYEKITMKQDNLNLMSALESRSENEVT